MKQFLVFMCPKCRNFTNAPVGQKRRRCSYCGHIIDIRKAASAIFDTPDQTSTAVKEFNASRGGDEFQKAVERSKERVRELMPAKRIEAQDLKGMKGDDVPVGKTKRLMDLLEKHAMNDSCSLDKIEELCNEFQLDWKWVEHQLASLSNAGVVIFPRPWTVQLVKVKEEVETRSDRTRDVTDAVMEMLRSQGGSARIQETIEYFEERGVSQASVESSLERLMRSGDIFEPKPGLISII
ncbi:MAG: hypothetical protein ACXABZ_08620 [Candidatus Thorarchaeota archaeon]|jgi:hypothetical protein